MEDFRLKDDLFEEFTIYEMHERGDLTAVVNEIHDDTVEIEVSEDGDSLGTVCVETKYIPDWAAAEGTALRVRYMGENLAHFYPDDEKVIEKREAEAEEAFEKLADKSVPLEES